MKWPKMIYVIEQKSDNSYTWECWGYSESEKEGRKIWLDSISRSNAGSSMEYRLIEAIYYSVFDSSKYITYKVVEYYTSNRG
mgnify:CR=1 FL=1